MKQNFWLGLALALCGALATAQAPARTAQRGFKVERVAFQ